MFTFYSDYRQITGKSHVWAAKITGNTFLSAALWG